jgi:hypothetical protein
VSGLLDEEIFLQSEPKVNVMTVFFSFWPKSLPDLVRSRTAEIHIDYYD